jgi:DNA excision repair protein ERCC-2
VQPEDIFPYTSFRHGQKELAASVRSACVKGERFVAEAMSGFGKTSAVLAGCLSAAMDEGFQVVYVCRTKRQVARVLEELNLFAKRLPVRATSLSSKFDYCLQRGESFNISPETFKWFCGFQTSNNLCSYFMNVGFNRDKVDELVDHHTSRPGTISELLESGMSLHVCPYEVARLSLARSNVIVTTYHYLFDKNSRSILITGERALDKVVVVIDEAHNIRDFVSGTSAVTITTSDLEDCIEDAKRLYLPRICSAISEVAAGMERSAKTEHWLLDKRIFMQEITGHHAKDWLSDLVFELSTNSGVAWYSVATGRNLPSSIIRVGGFLSALLSSLDSDHISLTKSDTRFFLTDTHPSTLFLSAISGFKSVIMLSATISPSDLFLRSIGLDGRSTVVHSTTTGYRFRIMTIIDTGVTTRFQMRTQQMFAEIARRVAAIAGAAPGSIGVFLPSYAVLEPTKERLLSEVNSASILVERPGMTNQEGDEMMRRFKASPGSILVAVQGGRFSEGEDFPGDGMDASVVVGLSLPPPSPTLYAEYKQMEADHFNKGQAHLVLSLLPALRKAFQCAGRHVRNPGKVGIVVFMDSRFASQRTIGLMPQWLREDLVKGDFGPERVGAVTRQFFSEARARQTGSPS